MVRYNKMESGKTYWFFSTKDEKVYELTFMYKVAGRKAFKFAQKGKKKTFIIHSSRFTHLFETRGQASIAFIQFATKRAVLRLKQAEKPLTPPDMRMWAEARGIPRKIKYGRW